MPIETPIGAPPGQGRERLESALGFFYRRWPVVLLTLAVLVAAAAVYAYTRPPTYIASALVKVDLSAAPRGSVGTEPLGSTGNVFATNDRTIVGEVFLLQTSVMIRQRVAQRLAQMDSTRGTAGGPSAAEGGSALPSGQVTFTVADQDASAILVSVASDDARNAALLANLYADEYVRQTEEAGQGRLRAEREKLEEQEERQRQELQRIEAEQRAQSVTGAGLGTGQEGSFVAMQIANLEAQRDQVQADLLARRTSLRTSQADLDALAPRLTQRMAGDDEQRLQTLQQEAAALREERALTERRYPDPDQRDPRVTARLQQLETELQRNEAEAQRISQQIVAGGVSEGVTSGPSGLAYAAQLRQKVQEDQAAIDALELRGERLDARIAQQYAELQRLPRAAMAQAQRQIAQAQLERDRSYAEQTYQEAATQLREAYAAEEAGGGYAQVFQAAQVPFEPTGIPASRFLLLGAFVGLTLGLGLALVMDKVDNHIYTPEQLRGWGYPVLATVPDIGPLLRQEFAGEPYVEMEQGRQLATRLVSLLSPMSPTAESYRYLRTNVLSVPSNGFPIKVLLVTSPGAEDGKSTTAANLAVAMAQAGHRTLLLDADLRRPSLHQLLSLPRSPGLLQHLGSHVPGGAGAANERPSRGEAVLPVPRGSETDEPEATDTGIDHLFFIPAGEVASMGDGAAPSATTATVIGSALTSAYLQWLREQFDFVVIDTPPVLATTDALQLARQCDGVLVVVRAGQTREGELSHVLDSLEQVGAPVIGTVLNGFDVSMAYGYKYRYRSYTEYGPYPEYGQTEERDQKGKRGGKHDGRHAGKRSSRGQDPRGRTGPLTEA